MPNKTDSSVTKQLPSLLVNPHYKFKNKYLMFLLLHNFSKTSFVIIFMLKILDYLYYWLKLVVNSVEKKH